MAKRSEPIEKLWTNFSGLGQMTNGIVI